MTGHGWRVSKEAGEIGHTPPEGQYFEKHVTEIQIQADLHLRLGAEIRKELMELAVSGDAARTIYSAIQMWEHNDSMLNEVVLYLDEAAGFKRAHQIQTQHMAPWYQLMRLSMVANGMPLEEAERVLIAELLRLPWFSRMTVDVARTGFRGVLGRIGQGLIRAGAWCVSSGVPLKDDPRDPMEQY